MGKALRIYTVLGALAALAATAVPSASAATRVVHEGESIQLALLTALPGDRVVVRPGTYNESIQIDKDRITLRGQNAVLEPPSGPGTSLCNLFGEGTQTGICVVGRILPLPVGPPVVLAPVEGVRVIGMTVRGFSGDGIFGFATKGLRVDHSRLIGNEGYGAFAIDSARVSFLSNLVRGSGEPGLYVGDSPDAHVDIAGNRVVGNGMGILLRSASHGRVVENVLARNCAGLFVLGGAPGPAGDFSVFDNRVRANNRFCEGEPEHGEPALSGVGIGLFGATRTKMIANDVRDHRPSRRCDGNCASPGGIVVVSGERGFVPKNDVVERNVALENRPFDLFWDRSGTVEFFANVCVRGKPASLCPPVPTS